MQSHEQQSSPSSNNEYPPLANVNDLTKQAETEGQRAADFVARMVGSWRFIIIQSIILAVWSMLNLVGWFEHWDPYPFILMNLVLSLQAAYTAPVIMMSQNRKADRDRIEAHNDYSVNMRTEKEVREIVEQLKTQQAQLSQLLEKMSTDKS